MESDLVQINEYRDLAPMLKDVGILSMGSNSVFLGDESSAFSIFLQMDSIKLGQLAR